MDNGVVLAVSNEKAVLIGGSQGVDWIDTGMHPFAHGVWPALYRLSPNEFAMVITGGGENGEAGEYIRFGRIESTTPAPRPRFRPIRNPVANSNSRFGR
jgi:hypothetical protein